MVKEDCLYVGKVIFMTDKMFPHRKWVICLTVYQFLVHFLTDGLDTKCMSLLPDNVTGQAQTESTPYHVNLPQATYFSSEAITVVLSSSQPFSGFLLQARSLSSHGNLSVGEFLSPLPNGSEYLLCSSPHGTVSSKIGEFYNYLIFDWQAPAQDVGNIRFKATFVYNSSTYWTGVEANNVLIYQPFVKTPTTKAVVTPTQWCPIVKCSCHGEAEIITDKFGCIRSCKCKYPCPVNSFQCQNGFCISEGYKCDGDSDCDDNSDEEDCPSVQSKSKTNYWYTPGRNAAVGVAIVLMLVIITYYMYRRYVIMYNQQGMVAVMSGQSWFRRPSQRERHETQLEIINAIIEARFERQTEQESSSGIPVDLPPYSPTDDQDVKPPPSYVQACGLPPPEYSEVSRTETCSGTETLDANSFCSQSELSADTTAPSASLTRIENSLDT